MRYLPSGYVEIEVTRENEGNLEAQNETVSGSEFGFEEGTEFRKGPDDSDLEESALFIAFREEYDLLVTVSSINTSHQRSDITVRTHGATAVIIIEDGLTFPVSIQDEGEGEE